MGRRSKLKQLRREQSAAESPSAEPRRRWRRAAFALACITAASAAGFVWVSLRSSRAPSPPVMFLTAEQQLDLPDSEISYATAALSLTRDVMPGYDVAAGLQQIDQIAGRVRELLAAQPDGEEPQVRIAAINTVLYCEYGFAYDMEDFPKQSPEKRLLGNLLLRGKGTCANLPDLYYAVAERLGFPIFMVEAPQHAFLRYELPDGSHINIEPTGRGGTSSDDEYIAEMEIPKKALELGTMMRTLSRREALLLLVSERAWHLERRGDLEGLLAQEALLRRLLPNHARVFWNSAVTMVVAGRAERDAANADPAFASLAEQSFAQARQFAARAAELGMMKPDAAGEYLKRQVMIRDARLGEQSAAPTPPPPWDTAAEIERLIAEPSPSPLDWATAYRRKRRQVPAPTGPNDPLDLDRLSETVAINRYNRRAMEQRRAEEAYFAAQADAPAWSAVHMLERSGQGWQTANLRQLLGVHGSVDPGPGPAPPPPPLHPPSPLYPR